MFEIFRHFPEFLYIYFPIYRENLVEEHCLRAW